MINKSAFYLRKVENDAWLEKADSPCNFYLFPKCLTAHLFRMMLSLQGCRNVWKSGGDASCKLVGIIYPLSLVEMWLTDMEKLEGEGPCARFRQPWLGSFRDNFSLHASSFFPEIANMAWQLRNFKSTK